jgi:hypothetical protein
MVAGTCVESYSSDKKGSAPEDSTSTSLLELSVNVNDFLQVFIPIGTDQFREFNVRSKQGMISSPAQAHDDLAYISEIEYHIAKKINS